MEQGMPALTSRLLQAKTSTIDDANDDCDTPTASAKARRKSNADGLALTKSGRVSMSGNEVNARYDASYRNSENPQTLLGRSLSLGQACGIIAVALHGPDIPLEEAGSF